MKKLYNIKVYFKDGTVLSCYPVYADNRENALFEAKKRFDKPWIKRFKLMQARKPYGINYKFWWRKPEYTNKNMRVSK